jgi:hypothetical protein
MRISRSMLALTVLALGCRTAVVSGPNKSDTKTVVTIHEEPKTQPSDKGLEVIDKR